MKKKSVSFNDTPQVRTYDNNAEGTPSFDPKSAQSVAEIIAVAGHLHLNKSSTHFRDMVNSQQEKVNSNEGQPAPNMQRSVSWDNWESFISQPNELQPQTSRVKA